MRNKKRIELLEIKVAFLNDALELTSKWLMDSLDRLEAIESKYKPEDIDSGKWYKNP
jgi:uncharacterized coiled-coil protein SlyX